MHPEAREWVQTQAAKHGPFGVVVECGSRNVNGHVRDLFPCDSYVGVDVAPGIGVDVVADFRDWQPTDGVSCVVCCEVVEHVEEPASFVAHAHTILQPAGCLILTAAAPPRAPHSAVDGGPLRDGEHYGNIDPDQLADWLAGWEWSQVHYEPHGDVYAVAVK